MTAAVVTLNQAAQVALVACEQRIERGLKTFIDVGQALAEIRDSRLYKGTHGTFEEYLEQRWEISRRHAYQLIESAEAVCSIEHTGLPAPTKESQARELAKMPEAERADAWRTAVERTGNPTAAVVKQVAEDRAAPDEQVQRRCFGCHHIFTSGADNGCPKCGGFGIRYKTPGPDGAVTAPPAGPGIEKPEPKTPPTSDAARELADEIARESERRVAVASIRSVLTYMTSRVLTPQRLADQYVMALPDFTADELRFAAQTLTALAGLKEL